MERKYIVGSRNWGATLLRDRIPLPVRVATFLRLRQLVAYYSGLESVAWGVRRTGMHQRPAGNGFPTCRGLRR